MYSLRTESDFNAAHFLTDYDGKCENLHGHRWHVVAFISSPDLQEAGQEKDMIIDFSAFKQALRKLTGAFDHVFLVEEGSLAPETIRCLENETFRMVFLPFRTTSENLARYFFERLRDEKLPVTRVEVYETPVNCAIYEE